MPRLFCPIVQVVLVPHRLGADIKTSERYEMKVTVYFEAKAGAHAVAQFDEEATYMVCLPALEELAKSQGYIVTESVDHAWTAEKFEPISKHGD